MPRASRLLGLLLAAAGCETGFRPETLIDDLRLVGVRAEPADLRPGEATQLSALVLDPSRAAPPTVLWVGCAPDPYNQNRSPCADPAVLQDPGSLTGGTGTLPPGVSVIGFNQQARYTVPATLFDVLPAEDPRRQTGTVGQIIAFAVAETVSPTASPEELAALFDRVQKKEVKSVIALFRVAVSEREGERNHNPQVEALTVDGERWPRGARVLVRPGVKATLDLAVADAALETWTAATPDGPATKTERLLVAWYSTAGRYSQVMTTLREAVQTVFTAPGAEAEDPVPERRAFSLYTVVRDTRGGQSWQTWPAWVCDEAAPLPVVTQVEWPSDAATPVRVRGSNLESIVDVVVDDQALAHGAFSPTSGEWQGSLPEGLPPGTARGTLHTRSCARLPLAVP